ncbi:hypothetical protein GCM10009862_27490 [Microbacterium binotii]|uniref:Uncharacterized protein n=1 Tax=Microbacterium binotii TaxID=462710 RepID=A0ABN3PL04_9MICO
MTKSTGTGASIGATGGVLAAVERGVFAPDGAAFVRGAAVRGLAAVSPARAVVVRAAGFRGAAGFFATAGFFAAAGTAASSPDGVAVRFAAVGRFAAGFFGATGAAASPSAGAAADAADDVAGFFAAGLRAAAGRAAVERGERGVDGRVDAGLLGASETSSAEPSSGVGASEPEGVEVTSPTYQPPLTIPSVGYGRVSDCHESTTAGGRSAAFQVARIPWARHKGVFRR